MNINLLETFDGKCYFRISDEYGNFSYRTNADREGLWRLNETTNEWKQLAGTSQFHLRKETDGGKRKAIRRFMTDGNDTFRIR